MRDAIRLRHFSLRTEKSYVLWLQSHMKAVRECPAEWAAEKKVERFLTNEARRGVSAGTQNQALNALLFFYQAVLGKPLAKIEAARAVRREAVRVALGLPETRALLAAVEDWGGYATRLVAHLL